MDQRNSSTAPRLRPEQWVDEHGTALFRFALARVGREDVAEDLVQEALLAALERRAAYRGHAAERTWLISILKRKAADHLRKKRREQPLGASDSQDAWVDALFDARDRWRTPPGRWGEQPDAALEQEDFWKTFDRCFRKLPRRLARVFQLRHLEENSIAKVCKEMSVSATNASVMMYRARMRLWRCLDKNWFHGEGRE